MNYEEAKAAEAVEMDKASHILLRAACAIERRGHCKFALRKGGAMCAIGALSYASRGHAYKGFSENGYEAFRKLTAFLGDDVVAWNNAPERTAQEVIDGMRAAALANAKPI